MTDGTDTGPRDDAELARGLLAESSSTLAHLYRGEIHRMRLWRERLDRTTNWAVIVMAAILTWAFSSETNPHYIILIGIAALTIFLVIEARRYRGYDIWRTRVRVLQENVFAYALDEDRDLADPQWREKLGQDYVNPTMKITAEEAIAHRLRRIYLAMILVLLVAWVIRITAFTGQRWPESAAIGRIPGLVISLLVAGFLLTIVTIAFRPRKWKGELWDEDALPGLAVTVLPVGHSRSTPRGSDLTPGDLPCRSRVCVRRERETAPSHGRQGVTTFNKR